MLNRFIGLWHLLGKHECPSSHWSLEDVLLYLCLVYLKIQAEILTNLIGAWELVDLFEWEKLLAVQEKQAVLMVEQEVPLVV